jgi:hypothetical protein
MVTVVDVNVCGYCLYVCVKCTIIPNIDLYIVVWLILQDLQYQSEMSTIC